MRARQVTDFLLLATAFCVTFEKVHWNIAGNVSLADILTFVFLIAFAVTRRGRVTRTVTFVVLFFAAFLLVYLLGFFNLETKQALDQFVKGMIKFVLHFLFLGCAVAYLARRGERFFWRTVGAFAAGFAANALYGALQLLAARAGHNLDYTVLRPLVGSAALKINTYGIVNGASVYRPNALTADPNHLGVMLIVPLLALAPFYLRLERGNRLRWPLGIALVFMLLILVTTLSRSAALGFVVGLLVLAIPYHRFAVSRRLLAPLGVVALVLVYFVYTRRHYVSVVLGSRLHIGGTSTSGHFGVYKFIPQVLHTHPLLGLGLNDFSVYYQFVTGKNNWGPHSYWVALIVETGLVGLVVYLVFLRYVFLRLRAARLLGRMLDRARDPLGARVRPLAWGLTAALAGTIASNFFYLTMQFYYFYALLAVALALPIVCRRRAS